MERHLLITVSEDRTALFGVRFVASFFTAKEDVRLTLLYVAPHGEATTASPSSALEAARAKCASLGFAEDRIDVKSLTQRHSPIRDILAESRRLPYDAVVLGRRGVSRLGEMLGESTSRGVLEEAASTPVWICRIPDTVRENVLLCVDGSEQAYRMADHVGRILGSDQDHGVTILSVLEEGADPESAAPVHDRSEENLTTNGLDPQRIARRVLHHTDPSAAIASLAREEGFAVVAAGRAASGGMFGQLFGGSVSTSLFRDSGGATLWVAK